MKTVSIIISTKNEETQIGACLDAIDKQDYPRDNWEVIVVDNNSSDQTKEIALGHGAQVYDHGPERSAQRNFGVSQASGKYILYLDADMRLSRSVLSECQKKCEEVDCVALYIPEKIIGKGFWIKVRDFERSFYNATCIDAVRFMRRDVFLNAGGFDENFNEGEDWDMDRRIKPLGKVSIIKAPLYHDEGTFSLRCYLRKKGFYSKNLYRYIEKWGRDDAIVKKQMGFSYRYFGVFFQGGKYLRFFSHPFLVLCLYFLKACVGFVYLLNKF